MANCHEYSKQGEGEMRAKPKTGETWREDAGVYGAAR